MTILQQLFDPNIAQEAIEAVSSNNPSVGPQDSRTAMVSLIVLLIANIAIIVINFLLDLKKSKKENHNYKIRRILEKTIQNEELLYARFLKIGNYQKGEEHQMLDDIIAVDKLMSEKKLYIGKKYAKIATEFLDYYKMVNFDITKKDTKKEIGYFEKLSKEFYGE